MNLDKIKQIYELLGDDTSKYIFENRLMYTLTGDTKFIRNVVCTLDVGKKIYELMRSNTKKKVIFGAGSVGKRLIRIYDDIKFECLVDNHHIGETYNGIRIIGIHELKERYSDALVIISTNRFHKEILDQLIAEGFRKENIINIGKEYEKLNHMQYFDLPQLDDYRVFDEVFVDGGCYDGANCIDFNNWCSGGAEVYAWEPDPDNQKKCEKRLEENRIKYKLIAKGLWSEKKTLRFHMDTTSSAITDDGNIVIDVDSIDNLVDKPATFIKMDIEGSEYQALLGAKRTIQKNKPKLAICIYHKPEDIWEIPQLIHELDNNYKFYLRHYSFGEVETVLYALQ